VVLCSRSILKLRFRAIGNSYIGYLKHSSIEEGANMGLLVEGMSMLNIEDFR